MKLSNACLAVILALPFQTLEAAYQTMPVKTRQIIIEDGIRRCELSRPSYGFHVEVVSDADGVKLETYRHSRPFVTAQPDERYAVRLYNPLPVRVAVNLTVDGINSITGKPSGISDGDKWLIAPYSFITIRGWQVNGAEERRFFFTPKPQSYAQWRGDQLGKDLAKNVGVIGAAYFWSQKELDAYYESNPQYRYSRRYSVSELGSVGAPEAAATAQDTPYRKGARLQNLDRLAEPKPQEEKAATGMGERESNPTTTVEFNYDTGMYKLSQAVVIYYDFAEVPTPNPFPALSYAPEMPE